MLTLGVNDLLVFNNDGIESSESRSLSESLQFDIVKLFSVAALSGRDGDDWVWSLFESPELIHAKI